MYVCIYVCIYIKVDAFKEAWHLICQCNRRPQFAIVILMLRMLHCDISESSPRSDRGSEGLEDTSLDKTERFIIGKQDGRADSELTYRRRNRLFPNKPSFVSSLWFRVKVYVKMCLYIPNEDWFTNIKIFRKSNKHRWPAGMENTRRLCMGLKTFWWSNIWVGIFVITQNLDLKCGRLW